MAVDESRVDGEPVAGGSASDSQPTRNEDPHHGHDTPP